MKIKDFVNNSINKYSFHFVAWIFPMLLFFIFFILYLLWLCFADKIDLGTGQTIAWFGMIFIPSVIMPCIIFLYILIFCTIQYYENIEINFRFNNKIFNKSYLFKIIFSLMFFIGIFFYLSLICYTTYTILLSDIYKQIFLIIGIPIMLSTLPIYFLVIRFLKNQINCNTSTK